MTEKEFLEVAFNIIWPDATVPELKELLDERIDKFLAYHHDTYFEVEFVSKKDLEEYEKNMTPIEKASLF